MARRSLRSPNISRCELARQPTRLRRRRKTRSRSHNQGSSRESPRQTIRHAANHLHLPRRPSRTVQRLLDHLRDHLRTPRLLDNRPMVQTNLSVRPRRTRHSQSESRSRHNVPRPKSPQRNNHPPVAPATPIAPALVMPCLLTPASSVKEKGGWPQPRVTMRPPIPPNCISLSEHALLCKTRQLTRRAHQALLRVLSASLATFAVKSFCALCSVEPLHSRSGTVVLMFTRVALMTPTICATWFPAVSYASSVNVPV